MQTCSKCNATSPDHAVLCVQCQSDLKEFSTSAVALQKFQTNPRVKAVRISVANDSCPHCQMMLRTHPKDAVPSLPHPGCSHPSGCRCTYEPVLSEMSIT